MLQRVLSHSDSTASQTVSEVCFRGHSVPILCSPVRAGFGPALIFKVRGCSTFPAQGERDAHPQLSGRLADFSSVPGHATQPHRLAAYSLGFPRAMCKQAKEHSRPESVHYISGSLHGLPGNESPPLAGTRGGHFVLPAPLQRRQLCSFEEISEAAGTHSVSFGSMSSGLITHATTAAMAEISSPLDSMDFGTFEYRGHLRLHRSSGAVVQPGSLQPGNPPGFGDFTRGGHNRLIWNLYGKAEVDLFATSENAHCPLFFSLSHSPLKGAEWAHSALASSQALCVSSDQNIASGVMQDQGGASVSDTHSPELAEPALVSRPDRAVDSTSLADSGQEGHAIPGGRIGVAPEPGTMEPSCVAASGLSEELNALQSRVINTLTEARAPSTRRLYALKWGVFVKWCHQAHINPVTCTMSDVLSFLQYRLDSGSLPSTLKVYVAAIAALRPPQGRQSIGRNAMVVSFLKGARRLHPPRPPSVPPWDLEVVLRALSQPPFKPLTSVGLKELSLKTTLLLALASAKRIGDLHAFSVDSDCIRFGPGDCSVTLRPRMGYVPKSLSTPFKTQTVSLSALSSESTASREADAQTSVCPVRALRIYIDRSASFRQSDQLFVCYGGCARGRAVSKQRLSHWIVDAITAAYTSHGLECPLHIRGHSTRAIASSWAWSRGMSIRDICVAAGWSSQNTFARFYKLDIQSFASQVLSVSG